MKIFLIMLLNLSKSIYGDFFYFPKENKDSIVIYLEVPVNFLVFSKYKNNYFTEMEINFALYDKNGEIVKGERISERIEVLRLPKDSIISKEFVILDTLKEKRASVKIINFEKEWKMERNFKREGDVILGDIVFLDDSNRVIHRVEKNKSIKVFMQIYSKKEIDEDFKIEFWRKNDIKKYFKDHLKGKGNIEINKEIDLENLSAGDYKVRVYFEKSKKYSEKILSFYGRYLFGDENFYMIVDALYYFADQKDVDSLRLAPFDRREKAWEKFWSKRDPSPLTPENEFEEEFLRRFYYANESFSTLNIPGYKTARGRIYILYGEPDEIERHPFEIDTYPYEIWYYYNKRLKFVFVDRKGTGEYELVPSDSYRYISPWR
ncbi:MAG: GWxTD domain-containing protein [candidate division WOR-3 bacterium]